MSHDEDGSGEGGMISEGSKSACTCARVRENKEAKARKSMFYVTFTTQIVN